MKKNLTLSILVVLVILLFCFAWPFPDVSNGDAVWEPNQVIYKRLVEGCPIFIMTTPTEGGYLLGCAKHGPVALFIVDIDSNTGKMFIRVASNPDNIWVVSVGALNRECEWKNSDGDIIPSKSLLYEIFNMIRVHYLEYSGFIQEI